MCYYGYAGVFLGCEAQTYSIVLSSGAKQKPPTITHTLEASEWSDGHTSIPQSECPSGACRTHRARE